MKYLAAYSLLILAGKTNPSRHILSVDYNDIVALLSTINCKID
jgi:ribosomal protein L12E/L44/L45/RPP1/RPP2